MMRPIARNYSEFMKNSEITLIFYSVALYQLNAAFSTEGQMTRIKKAAGCPHTQAAQQIIYRINFTQITMTLKAASFWGAAWLSIIGGALL